MGEIIPIFTLVLLHREIKLLEDNMMEWNEKNSKYHGFEGLVYDKMSGYYYNIIGGTVRRQNGIPFVGLKEEDKIRNFHLCQATRKSLPNYESIKVYKIGVIIKDGVQTHDVMIDKNKMNVYRVKL